MPRPCARPNCLNGVASTDGRVRYCQAHRPPRQERADRQPGPSVPDRLIADRAVRIPRHAERVQDEQADLIAVARSMVAVGTAALKSLGADVRPFTRERAERDMESESA